MVLIGRSRMFPWESVRYRKSSKHQNHARSALVVAHTTKTSTSIGVMQSPMKWNYSTKQLDRLLERAILGKFCYCRYNNQIAFTHNEQYWLTCCCCLYIYKYIVAREPRTRFQCAPFFRTIIACWIIHGKTSNNKDNMRFVMTVFKPVPRQCNR